MNVQFDDANSSYNLSSVTTSKPGMVGWLIKKGWVQDSSQANVVLIVFSIIIIVLSALIFKYGTQERGPDDSVLPPETNVVENI
jgi:hypothetical protein